MFTAPSSRSLALAKSSAIATWTFNSEKWRRAIAHAYKTMNKHNVGVACETVETPNSGRPQHIIITDLI